MNKNKLSIILVIFIMTLFTYFKSFSQEKTIENDTVLTIVSSMPEFPGGIDSLIKYLSTQVKYPILAKENGIDGTVYVTFVVSKDGDVKDMKILRGIGGGCDEEAIRVINNMPKWKPGMNNNQKVNVQYNLPIRFKLIDIEKEFNNPKNDNNTTLKKEELPNLAHVEVMPEFPGGVNELSRFIRDNLFYPQKARDGGVSGTVYATFVVDIDGNITKIKILRGIGYGCDEEVIRIIKLMPKWEPGRQDGKNVPVQYNMPIKFNLY